MKRISAIAAFLLLFSFAARSQFYYGGLYWDLPRTNFVVDSAGHVRFQPHDLKFSLQTGAYWNLSCPFLCL